MLLNPAVLALVAGSMLVCAVAVLAAVAGLTVVVGWNPADSGARQLARERRSSLVEAAIAIVLGCQLASLFLFVATSEHLHTLFTGAMCAAGTLHADRFGYPTLAVKLALFALSGLWLVVNRETAAAASTGLIRFKNLFLILVCAGLVGENVLQFRYFCGLDPDIITSCCATIFSDRAAGLGRELAALPPTGCRTAFLTGLGVTLGAGATTLRRRGSPAIYAVLAPVLGALSMAAVVSWVAPAFYQLPTHHCPFCLLSAEHHYLGYPLFAALGVAVIAGAGSGVVHSLRAIDPLRCIRPGAEHRLCRVSMTGFLLFSLIALWPVVATGDRVWGG